MDTRLLKLLSDKTRYLLITIFTLLLTSILLVGCGNEPTHLPNNTPAPSVETNTPIPEMNTPIAETNTPTPIPPGTTNLTVIVSDTGGQKLGYESAIAIFLNNQLVQTGATKEGVYMVGLPSGIYDVALIYGGKPSGQGQIKKDIALIPNAPNVVGFSLSPESKLKTRVLMKSGMDVFKDSYYVTIVTGNQRIIDNEGITSSSAWTLTAGNTYSVTIHCGSSSLFCFNTETIKHNVEIVGGQTTEDDFSLPYDVSKLVVSSANGAILVIVDANTGNTVFTHSFSYSSGNFIVESGKKYKVQVTLDGNMQEQNILPSAGEEIKMTFTFPKK